MIAGLNIRRHSSAAQRKDPSSAAIFLVTDFEVGFQKKLGRRLFDRKPDGGRHVPAPSLEGLIQSSPNSCGESPTKTAVNYCTCRVSRRWSTPQWNTAKISGTRMGRIHAYAVGRSHRKPKDLLVESDAGAVSAPQIPPRRVESITLEGMDHEAQLGSRKIRSRTS